MPSMLAWLAHSESERDRIRDAISLLSETDTRDELGISTIRDGFADLLFPGVTVVQRRARYFLFIPWMYAAFERKQIPSAEIATRARRFEIALIEQLVASDDHEGTIGIDARGSLKRLPSNIYWHGLGAWGIRRFRGSQDDYHRALDRFYLRRTQARRDDDGEPVEAVPRNWDPHLPSPPDEFGKSSIAMSLRRNEAEFLRERILSTTQGSLLAWLVALDRVWEPVPLAWMHPDYGGFPAPVRQVLEHGRNFSDAIHGAFLLYNLMLAEKRQSEELFDRYRQELRDWAAEMALREPALRTWDELRLWQVVTSGGARISTVTRSFVSQWLALALPPGAAARIPDSAEARALLLNRERLLKRDQARLTSLRALERWNGGAGVARLDYRWGRGQSIVFDILAAGSPA